MDVGNFDLVVAAEKPQLMALSTPDGRPLLKDAVEGAEPEPFTLPVLSFDNEKVVQAGRDFDRENAKEKAAYHEHDWARMRRGAVAAAAVPDWCGLTAGGVAFNPTNAPGLIGSRRYSWIADQVFMFGGYRGNYFRATPTGS